MHPAELMQAGSSWAYEEWSETPGIAWLDRVARHFRKTAWLNPEPESYWRGTAATSRGCSRCIGSPSTGSQLPPPT